VNLNAVMADFNTNMRHNQNVSEKNRLEAISIV